MSQSVIMFEAPKVVAACLKEMERARLKLERAESNCETLDRRLRIARESIGEIKDMHTVAEKTYVLTCCLELETLLANEKKGWCPICKDLVAVEFLAFASTYETRHYPESRASDHGYMGGGSSAYDVTYTYAWRVPHRGSHNVFTERDNGIRYSYGGTIACAPLEIFTSFGIPMTKDLLDRVSLGVFDFPLVLPASLASLI